MKPSLIIEKILRETIKDNKTGCWNWFGTISKFGYGRQNLTINKTKKRLSSSRASFLAFNNYDHFPDKSVFICHTCNNRKCVNPDHLYAGTAKTNADDCINSGRNHNKNKTHCSLGHKLTKSNIYFVTSKLGTKRRSCKKCRNMYSRLAKVKSKYRSRRRAEARLKKLNSGEMSLNKFNFYNRRADVKSELQKRGK